MDVDQQHAPPVQGEPDETLAQRARTDHAAFAELVHRYADRIYNLAYRMTGDAAAAEDLAQETFLRAYRGLAGFRPEHAFGAWLYRIAVNMCISSRRRSSVAEPLPADGATVLDSGLSPDELYERQATQAAVQQAIVRLPPMYRAAVVLYHIEGRSYQDIARMLRLPVNTVRTRLHRGRALLRELLREQMAGSKK